MPRVTLRTGFVAADGTEETLSEYVCDWPDCPNVAEETVGVIRELGAACILCREHAAALRKRGSTPPTSIG